MQRHARRGVEASPPSLQIWAISLKIRPFCMIRKLGINSHWKSVLIWTPTFGPTVSSLWNLTLGFGKSRLLASPSPKKKGSDRLLCRGIHWTIFRQIILPRGKGRSRDVFFFPAVGREMFSLPQGWGGAAGNNWEALV